MQHNGDRPEPGGMEHISAADSLEVQMLQWLKDLLDLPHHTGGVLVSGAALANLTALAVARDAQAGLHVREAGVQTSTQRLTLYASHEAHPSIARAVELLGLGRVALRLIDVTDDYTITMQKLRVMIDIDIALGYRPFCVVGNVGTFNTGAIDDLHALADLCQHYHLWLHLDGTYGALGALDPAARQLVAGMERSDSLTVASHPWLPLRADVAGVFFRNAAAHRETLAATLDGPGAGAQAARALTIGLTRQAVGDDTVQHQIAQQLAQAQVLAQLIRDDPRLELLAPVALHIVCFRYNPGGLSTVLLNKVNERVLVALQQQGVTMLSSTTLGGVVALRCAIVTDGTGDLRWLVAETVQRGAHVVETILRDYS